MKTIKLIRNVLPVVLLAAVLLLSACSNASKLEKALQLSEQELTLMEGETKTVTVTNPKEKDVGEYTVAWMTKDPTVATVTDEGEISALTEGKTTVTAAVRTEKAEVYFDLPVTVTKNTLPLTGIAFSASVYTLGEGQTLNLAEELEFTPTHAGKKALKWTSSNTAIATVSDGVVSPVSQGITTVTVSTEDGAVSASCTVRVSEIAVNPTGVSLEKEEYTLSVGETLTLTPTVKPENATGYSILWASEDPTIATATGGRIVAVAEGETVVSVRLSLGNDLKAECKIIVEPAENVTVPAKKVQLTPSNMTIPENADGPFKFGLSIEPANCTEKPVWSTSRPDLLRINESSGEFTVIKAPTDTTASVIVTCTVGTKSAEGVVNIDPRKPKLEITPSDNAAETLYDKAPLNTLELSAAFVGSETLADVTWHVTDPSVATVNANGVLTAHKPGTCTVSVISKADKNIGATYTVTVRKANFISLTVGETQTVTPDPSLYPSDIKWQATGLYLDFDPATMRVTGKSATEGEPAKLYGDSPSTGDLYTLYVYVLPKEQ